MPFYAIRTLRPSQTLVLLRCPTEPDAETALPVEYAHPTREAADRHAAQCAGLVTVHQFASDTAARMFCDPASRGFALTAEA